MSNVSFNSNVASLKAMRNLSKNTERLGSTFERLSSGLRINRASDDAAGLAIADKLRADTRLYSAAARNINDAISLVNIASSSVSQQKLILTRMQELAEQSANGVYSAEQRAALDVEYQALIKEFGRIGDSTTFNSLELLRGTRGDNPEEILIQAGISGDALSVLGLTTADTGTLSGVISDDMAAGGFLDSKTEEDLFSQYDGQLFFTSFIDDSGVERDIYVGVQSISASGLDQSQVSLIAFQRVSDTGGVGDQSIFGINGEVLDLDHDWVIASTTSVTFYNATGKVVSEDPAAFNLEFENRTVTGTLELDVRGLEFNLDLSAAPIFVQSPNKPASSIDFSSVKTADSSLTALEMLDRRLTELSQIEGEFGALTSRLQSSANVVGATRENVVAAEARIRDVDVAEESAKLAAAQILQQVGAAVLAQANTAPEIALQLLDT